MNRLLEDDLVEAKSDSLKVGVPADEFRRWENQSQAVLRLIGLTQADVRRLADRYGMRV